MSNKGLVLKENISNIAEEIRQSLGISTTYKPRELAQAVHNAILKYKQNNPTATSTDGNLTNAYDVPMVDYEIDGKSEQDTTNGKNKLVTSLEIMKSRNTTGTWNNNIYTLNGITFTVNEDLTVKIGGTYTSETRFNLTTFYYNIVPQLYMLTGNPILVNYSLACDVMQDGVYLTSYTDGGSGTYVNLQNVTNPSINMYINVNNASFIGQTFKPMLRLSTESESYEPYTGGQPSPSPDYPQEIRAVGDLVESGEHAGKYEIPVRVRGKNLFLNNRISTPTTKNGVTFTPNTDGTYTLNGTASASSYFDVNIEYNSGWFTLSNVENTSISQTVGGYTLSASITNGKIDIGHNANNGIWSILAINGQTYNDAVIKVQLEQGSTATDYEPYHEPIITPIYLDRPLYNLPNGAKDKIRFSTGKRTNAVGEDIFNGSEIGWLKSGESRVDRYFIDMPLAKYAVQPSALSNNFAYEHLSISIGRFYLTIYETTQVERLFINYATTGSSTLTDFKQWLSTHNTQVLYELATPTEESIDLPQLNLWEGTNIIEIGTDVQPSEVEYVYITKVNN